MTLLSVLFTRETCIWEDVATAARDGSSLSMEPSAVVLCLLTQCCGSEILGKTTTDPGSLSATIYGKIRIGINIRNCVGYGNSDGQTGRNSVSRLIIEEVPRSQ